MKTPETDKLVEKSSAYLGGAYLAQDAIDLAKRLEVERDEWKKKYYDVADAVCRESHGVEDLCRQARELRKAAYDKDGTPWSTVSEWWRAKFEAAEKRMIELLEYESKHAEMRNALACLVCSGPSHPNEINLSPVKTERYFADVRRAQILILGDDNAKKAGLIR